MNKLLLSLLFLTFFMASCSHKVTTTITKHKKSLSATAKVMIVHLDESVPEGAIKLGKVKLGDSGFSMKCTWYEAIAKAKIEARKAGGNIIKITKHRQPNGFTSMCHRVWADIYKLDRLEDDGGEDNEYKLQPEPVAGVDYPKARLGISGGWSNRIGKAPDGVNRAYRDYIKDLKSGGHFGADFHFFVSPTLGLGGVYSSYFSDAKLDNYILANGSISNRELKESITMNYFGASVINRYPYKKNFFLLGANMGYLGYKDLLTLNNNQGSVPLKISGSSFGFGLNLGMDMRATDRLSIGLQFDYLAGTLSKYTISNGTMSETVELEEDAYENLSRIDLSVGLRYYLGVPK